MTAPSERRERGIETWKRVTQKPVGEPVDPISQAMIDFNSAEVWSRPGLAFRDRRWISLTCAAIAAQPKPIQSHVRSAILSGDITPDELREFALHFAVYAGWPLASFVSGTINEVVKELAASGELPSG
jgi:4-carboxymuconolactone decarboxylase